MASAILALDFGMLPSYQIDYYLSRLSPGLSDIVREIRNLVAEIAPYATELMHSRGMSYFDAQRGGTVSAGICQIIIYRDHIRLAFIHGAYLPDPRGLLEGSTKAKRFVRINSYEDAPWDYFKELIRDHAHFDPYTVSFRS